MLLNLYRGSPPSFRPPAARITPLTPPVPHLSLFLAAELIPRLPIPPCCINTAAFLLSLPHYTMDSHLMLLDSYRGSPPPFRPSSAKLIPRLPTDFPPTYWWNNTVDSASPLPHSSCWTNTAALHTISSLLHIHTHHYLFMGRTRPSVIDPSH